MNEEVIKDRIADNKKAVADYINAHKKDYKDKRAFRNALNKQIQDLKIPDRMANLNQILFFLDVKRAL